MAEIESGAWAAWGLLVARKEGKMEREEGAIFWRGAVLKGAESERDCRGGGGNRACSRLCGETIGG
jgi:hypothetical protein